MLTSLLFQGPRFGWGSHQFNSTPLLTSSVTAIQTYWYQSQLHGWALHSTGLPQCAVDTCLLSFLQEFILDIFEGNQPVPETITIWREGRHQMALFSRLVESLPCLGMALLVWDLEDISAHQQNSYSNSITIRQPPETKCTHISTGCPNKTSDRHWFPGLLHLPFSLRRGQLKLKVGGMLGSKFK